MYVLKDTMQFMAYELPIYNSNLHIVQPPLLELAGSCQNIQIILRYL